LKRQIDVDARRMENTEQRERESERESESEGSIEREWKKREELS